MVYPLSVRPGPIQVRSIQERQKRAGALTSKDSGPSGEQPVGDLGELDAEEDWAFLSGVAQRLTGVIRLFVR
jgi:hypothetical protein